MKKNLLVFLMVCLFPVMVLKAQIDTCIVSTYIISSPPGAKVYVGERFVGQTPLSIKPDTIGRTPVILRHPGYKDYVILSASIKAGLIMINMEKEADLKNVQELQKGMLFGVPVSLIAAAGVVSGAAAAYFKVNADKMFANYQSQALGGHYDEGLLKKVNQYDRYSAAGLVVMEICAAALVYYLFRIE